jgi:hypothetical protein
VEAPAHALDPRPALEEISHSLRVRTRATAVDGDWPRTTRILPWGLAAFLVMLWLIPFDNVLLPFSLPLDATPDRPLLAGLAFLCLLVVAGSSETRRFRAGPVHWALGAFALIALVSLLQNYEMLDRLNELSPAFKRLTLLFTYGLLFVVAIRVIRPSEVSRFVALMVGLASVTAVGILVEYRLGYNAFYTWTGALLPGTTPPSDIGTYDSIGRLTVVGPGGHPLAPATMMAVALPFALTGLLASSERRTKIAYGTASALMLGAALATQRKTSLVLPVAVLVVLVSYRPRQMVRLVPLGLVMFALIHFAAPGAIGGVGDQLKPSALTGVLTTKDRVSDYDAIKPDVANHILLGRGYDSFDQKKIRILDNQYLTLLVNTGVLGVLAYLGMFAAGLWVAGGVARARDPGASRIGVACVAAFVALLIGSGLMDTLALPQIPYLFCFVAALAVVTARAQGRNAT